VLPVELPAPVVPVEDPEVLPGYPLCPALDEPLCPEPIDPDDDPEDWLPVADVPLPADPLVPALPLCATAAPVHVTPTADNVRPNKIEVPFILNKPPADYDGGPLPQAAAGSQRN
jgi:hypothetical protein